MKQWKLLIFSLIIPIFTSIQYPSQAQTTIIINPSNPQPNQRLQLKPTSRAGNYWVYQKPANISESQMQMAGASFYSSPQATSLCQQELNNIRQ